MKLINIIKFITISLALLSFSFLMSCETTENVPSDTTTEKGEFEVILLNYQGDTLDVIQCNSVKELDDGIKYTDLNGSGTYTNLPVIVNY